MVVALSLTARASSRCTVVACQAAWLRCVVGHCLPAWLHSLPPRSTSTLTESHQPVTTSNKPLLQPTPSRIGKRDYSDDNIDVA
jgi:hypothetical protein